MDDRGTSRLKSDRVSGAADTWPCSAHEAARLLGVSERTIRRAITHGELIASKRAGVFRITEQALADYLEQSQRTSSRGASARRRSRVVPLPEASSTPPVLRLLTHDLDGPAFTLPRPLSPFLGRERDVAALIAALSQTTTRLLTVTGPGGAGKTRLALRVAAQLTSHFADGVAFVPLAAVTDASLVPSTVAQALGVRDHGGRQTGDRLVLALQDREVLLVLDNFEHVLSTATLVTDLLAACPALTILVTSRMTLGVSGEQRFPVLPLTLPELAATLTAAAARRADAVELFVVRAQAMHPTFTLTDDNAGAVADICRRLDGLPLAIELAAARAAVLPPHALLTRLERRLPLLTGGPRDAPRRLRTMRDAIAWSHDLLSIEEQVLFRRLAVFVGGCTLEAAEAVAGGGDVLEGIDSLVAGSLVHVEDDPHGDPRYVMLETIREFAREHLVECGELDEIHHRHAAWYLAVAEEAEDALRGGPDQAHWLARLAPELPNLRNALGWLEASGDTEAMMRLAGALGGFWFWGSHRREGAAWLERALAAADVTPTPGRGKALLVLGFQGMEQGSAQATAYASESAAVWTTLGDAWRAADARLALGQILEYRAEYARAIPLLEESAQYWEEQGDLGRMAIALYFLGQAALDHDDGPRANTLFQDAMDRFRRSGYAWGVSAAFHQLGEVAALQGNIQAAAAAYATSLGGTGSQENLVGQLVAVGRLAAVNGHAELAVRLLGAAEAVAETIGYVRRQPEQDRLERDAAYARDALGGTTFATAWKVGRALPPDRAVAEALAVLTALGAPVAPGATPPARTPLSPLTPREREVLDLMCAHLQDREIADRLFLSPRTVESHVSRILDKLGVSRRREAIAIAAGQAPS